MTIKDLEARIARLERRARRKAKSPETKDGVGKELTAIRQLLQDIKDKPAPITVMPVYQPIYVQPALVYPVYPAYPWTVTCGNTNTIIAGDTSYTDWSGSITNGGN